MCELLEEEVGSSSRNKEAGQNAKWAANMLGGGGTTGRAVCEPLTSLTLLPSLLCSPAIHGGDSSILGNPSPIGFCQ